MKEKRKTTSIQTLKPTTFLKEELASALSRITQEHILGSGMRSEPMLMLAKNNKRKIGKKKKRKKCQFFGGYQHNPEMPRPGFVQVLFYGKQLLRVPWREPGWGSVLQRELPFSASVSPFSKMAPKGFALPHPCAAESISVADDNTSKVLPWELAASCLCFACSHCQNHKRTKWW